MLDALARAQANGVDPAEVARVRDDLARIGDDFIRALATLSQIDTVSGSSQPATVLGSSGPSGPSGTEWVPPRGVPEWTACRALTASTYRCRPLAGLANVAGGTPVYWLQTSSDWRSIPAPPQGSVVAQEAARTFKILATLLGRKPNADEMRFLSDFFTVAIARSGGSPAPVTTSTPPVTTHTPVP